MENDAFGARVAPDSAGQTSRLPRLTHACAQTVRWSLVALFALMPLFFLPLTVDTLEINKQTLLVILTFVAALAWLGQMVSTRALTLRSGWLNAFPAFLWLAVLVSSALSNAPFLSWIGGAHQEYLSFLSMTGFVLMFYLLVNTASDSKTQRRLFMTMIISATALVLFLLLQGLGVRPLGFLGVTSPVFNPVGGAVAAAIYLLVVTLLANGLWLINKRGEGHVSHRTDITNKVLSVALSLLTLCYLIAQDFWVLWVLLVVGVAVLFSFAMVRANEFVETGKFILPMTLVVVSILLLCLKSPISLSVPTEVSPSFSLSWTVATKTLSGSAALFGTGPGTYIFDYALHHGTSLNNSVFWSTRFERGNSHLTTVAPTLGIVGLIALITFVAAVKIKALNRLVNEHNHDEWKMTFVLFAPWSAIVLAMFLYGFNMSLSFLFFALSGLLASQVMLKTKTFAFNKSPRMGLGFSFLFVLLAVGIVTGLFVTGQRYAAETAFAKAVKLDKNGGSVDEIISALARAESKNRLSDSYKRALAQSMLTKVRNELALSQGGQIAPEKTQELQALIIKSIQAAEQASRLSPNNVANWELLGAIYREISPIVGGADAQAIAAIQKSISLEPANPAHLNSLAQAYLVFAEAARTRTTSGDSAAVEAATSELAEYLQKAEEALVSAIALKTDYAPAHYYLAISYERQGRLADAVSKMETVKRYNPLDVGVAFQLGLLYLRQGNYGAAQTELERAVALNPTYANALWFLAAIYEQNGEMNKAIEQVTKVLELNPDNELVSAKLNRLKAGIKSPDLPEPIESDTSTAITETN